jgi:outer membrane receptor for monomeric catechols
MRASTLRTIAIAVVAISLCNAAFAGDKRSRHPPAAYTDQASSYKADRLSSRRPSELDTPGQTTVLTRETLDDMNATTLRDALRSTAGVTVGR